MRTPLTRYNPALVETAIKTADSYGLGWASDGSIFNLYYQNETEPFASVDVIDVIAKLKELHTSILEKYNNDINHPDRWVRYTAHKVLTNHSGEKQNDS